MLYYFNKIKLIFNLSYNDNKKNLFKKKAKNFIK